MKFTMWIGSVATLLLCFAACQPESSSPTSPDVSNSSNSAGKYDGTYDFSVVSRGRTLRCSDCVFISNGRISNSDGSFSGQVLDNFGNVSFKGRCPIESCLGSCATYTGILNWGAIGGSGQGQWDCGNGVRDRWSFTNGTRGAPSVSSPAPPPPAPSPAPPPSTPTSSGCDIICWACSGNHGAIAYSSSTGRCGWSVDYSNSNSAGNAAERECGRSDCRTVLTFRNACGALATSSSSAGWAWAGSRSQAEQSALNECRARQ